MKKRAKEPPRQPGPLDGFVRPMSSADVFKQHEQAGRSHSGQARQEEAQGRWEEVRKEKKHKEAAEEMKKRPNDARNHTTITMLALVQALYAKIGTLHPTPPIFNMHLFAMLTKLSTHGSTATFGVHRRTQAPITIPETTARRWWKQYANSYDDGDPWEVLRAIADHPKDGRKIEAKLEDALSKAKRAGQKSPLSERVQATLEKLADYAAGTREGLH